jgi:hypothetical protein
MMGTCSALALLLHLPLRAVQVQPQLLDMQAHSSHTTMLTGTLSLATTTPATITPLQQGRHSGQAWLPTTALREQLVPRCHTMEVQG